MKRNTKTQQTVIITLAGDMPAEGTLYEYLVNELENHGIQAEVTEINAPHSVVEAAPEMLAELHAPCRVVRLA